MKGKGAAAEDGAEGGPDADAAEAVPEQQHAAQPKQRHAAGGRLQQQQPPHAANGSLTGWDSQQQLVSDHLVAQARQALLNIVAILDVGGAKPEHIVRLTWYVTSRADYLAAAAPLGAACREVIGRHFPAMTAVEVSALMERGAVIEIEATAVIPD